MDDWKNSSSASLSQPADDMAPLPAIHAPQSFRPPETTASHFEAPAQPAHLTSAPPSQPPAITSPPPPAQPHVQSEPSIAPQTTVPQAGTDPAIVVPGDDTDTAFDEEWVNKAKEVVERTHADPYLQSRELGKLKAQYIKLRYNKDVKLGE